MSKDDITKFLNTSKEHLSANEPERRGAKRRVRFSPWLQLARDHGPVTPVRESIIERRQNPPALTPCPQCTSMYCGPWRCRFSGIQHEEYKRIAKRIRKAARAAQQVGTAGVQIGILLDVRKRQDYGRVAERTLPSGVVYSFEQQGRCVMMQFHKLEAK